MIEEWQLSDRAERQALYELICRDNARNYFIRLGLEQEHPVFQRVFVERDGHGDPVAALMLRKSGNLQFFAMGAFDADGFSEKIGELDFQYLISPGSYCDRFLGKELFLEDHSGAYIAELTPSIWEDRKEKIPDPLETMGKDKEHQERIRLEELELKDLPEVVELYGTVFSSFSPEKVMRKKLETGRGRGKLIRLDGRLVAVAQSEFENRSSGIIVGVATDPEYQGKGLGTACLLALVKELMAEGKTLYLQYDNPKAGMIYRRLGFYEVDRVRHYKKKVSETDHEI